jgi:nucleoside-diphosphate-sugar epimerase
MSVFDHVRMRVRRGIRLRTLGPNEARFLFDSAVAVASALAAVLFVAVFVSRDGAQAVAVALIPALSILGNIAFGLYSRLRKSRTRVKIAAILGSSAATAVAAFAFGISPETVVLFLLLSVPSTVLARLFLNLPNSRIRRVALIATNMRGPVLVIGGAGYIGSHTVEQLLIRGYPVRVLDNLMYGNQSLNDFMNDRDFELVEGDASDLRKVGSAMRDASAVIHLAGLVGDTRHTNIVTTRMAKDIAQSLGVRRFIFASSCSVYGASDVEVDELGKLNPVSLYAQTKIDSEQELLASRPDDFHVTILRFATVFGHSRRHRFDLVGNLFTAQAMTEGRITVIGPEQWRPLIHVRDVARAAVAVLDADPRAVDGQIFNVGDARQNMTILQLAHVVRDVTSRYRDVEISVRDDVDDRRNYVVSFAKIRDVLGYRAETSIEDGVREMAEHFRSNHYYPYRDEIYSNVAMIRKVLTADPDPAELMHRYDTVRLA